MWRSCAATTYSRQCIVTHKPSRRELNLLGAAFEYLIGVFADSAGKKGGEFYTPRSVVRMMVRLIQLEHDDDTLAEPRHVADGELMHFDRVLTNPPFSITWGNTAKNADDTPAWKPKFEAERFPYGQVPLGAKKADLMFLQHMLSVTCDVGLVAKEAAIRTAFEAWWQQDSMRITGLAGQIQSDNGGASSLVALRQDLLESFSQCLEAIGLLDPFQVRGIVADFWYQTKYQFLTLMAGSAQGVMQGRRTSIITALEDKSSKESTLDHKPS